MDHTTTTRLESNSKSGMIQNLALHFDSALSVLVLGDYSTSLRQIRFLKWR